MIITLRNTGRYLFMELFIKKPLIMSTFRITEEQMRYAISEGITLNADVDAVNGDVARAVDVTKNQATKNGLDAKKVTIQIPPSNESKKHRKNTLHENTVKKLKENSTLYSTKDFFKLLTNKQ